MEVSEIQIEEREREKKAPFVSFFFLLFNCNMTVVDYFFSINDEMFVENVCWKVHTKMDSLSS